MEGALNYLEVRHKFIIHSQSVSPGGPSSRPRATPTPWGCAPQSVACGNTRVLGGQGTSTQHTHPHLLTDTHTFKKQSRNERS